MPDNENQEKSTKLIESPALYVLLKSKQNDSLPDIVNFMNKNGLDLSSQMIDPNGDSLSVSDILKSRTDINEFLKNNGESADHEISKDDIENSFKDPQLTDDFKNLQDIEDLKSYRYNHKYTNEQGEVEETKVVRSYFKDSNSKNFQHIQAGNISGSMEGDKGFIEYTEPNKLSFNFNDGSKIKVHDDGKDLEYDLSQNTGTHNLGSTKGGVRYKTDNQGNSSPEFDINKDLFEQSGYNSLKLKLSDDEFVQYKDGTFTHSKDGVETEIKPQEKDGYLVVSDLASSDQKNTQQDKKDLGTSKSAEKNKGNTNNEIGSLSPPATPSVSGTNDKGMSQSR